MLSTAQVQELVERMLKSSGRRVDISRPFVDAMLPEGHRLHVVTRRHQPRLLGRQHPQVRAPRREPRRAGRAGQPDPRAASFLEMSVRAGLNILDTGGTQAGKPMLVRPLTFVW